MLEAGRDISARVPTMYDISGWSHRLLWGASVDIAQDGDLRVLGKPVAAAAPTGAVQAPAGSDLHLALVDGKDVSAVNALVADGVRVRWAPDGSVVVRASARAAAVTVADRFGARFTAAPAGAGGTVLDRTVIGAAAAADELEVLRDMGFEVRPVSTASLAASTTPLEGADVLYVSSGLVYDSLTSERQPEVQAFLRTAGVVTSGLMGATFNAQAGLLTATSAGGPGNANGVVRVVNAGSPVTAGALPHSFVYSPRWFTRLGPEVVAEQRYAASDVVVAGHWIGTTNGPSAAAGQASVLRGKDERGASVVLFGTEPMFRDHPKGLYSQVARAVLLTDVTAGAAVVAPYPPGLPRARSQRQAGRVADLEDVRRLALLLPGAQERSGRDGTVSWTVRGTGFVWERPLRRGDLEALGAAAPSRTVLGVRVADLGVKQALLADDPDVVFTTPHFDGYPIVLVRLGDIALPDLEELVVDAWRARASQRQRAQLDG
jgi:hypothetical protein